MKTAVTRLYIIVQCAVTVVWCVYCSSMVCVLQTISHLAWSDPNRASHLKELQCNELVCVHYSIVHCNALLDVMAGWLAIGGQ